MDSGTPFPGVRLATPGPPTGCLRTKGPPYHGGREIREAPPPSRRPGPRGVGERTSPRAPFTLLCLHPIPWSPGRESQDPRASTQAVGAHTEAQARGTQLAWIWFRVVWVLVDRTSETKQPSPEDSPHPRGLRRLGWLLPWSSEASRPRSPPLGMQSLLRMCACSCVCVFIRMSLFKKQSSLWGSWTLHVRVSPPIPSPATPLPRAHPSPPLLSSQPCCSLQRKELWETPGLPTYPPAPACWGCLHASPRAQGYPTPISFPPFN